jgi:Holliday junction DNA helicase RuvB
MPTPLPKSKGDADDILDELSGKLIAAPDDDDDDDDGGDPFNRSIVRDPRALRMADDNLRPQTLDEIIGQESIKSTLNIYMRSAQRRGQPLDHLLLTGPPGVGKTTIASVIAGEMDFALIIDTGPTLNRDKMMNHVTSIINTADAENKMIVLFVDEVHDLPKDTQTILLPLLEEFKYIDVFCPKFTFIGATTNPAKLPLALRDRMPIKYHLDYYTDEDLLKILKRSYRLLWELDDEEKFGQYVADLFHEYDEEIEEVDESDGTTVLTTVHHPSTVLDALRMLAHRAKGVPRVANQLLKRTLDFSLGYLDEEEEMYYARMDPDIVTEAMKAQGIDKNGLTAMDRKILVTLFTRYHNRAGVGINAIAAAIGEDRSTVEDVYEPNLVRLGFLERGERGRQATTEGQLVAAAELSHLTEY